MITRALPILGVLLFLLGPAFFGNLDPTRYTGGRSVDEQRKMERNSSAISQLLGEFRTSMSDIMFMKTELYLHSGVAFTPHLTESDAKGTADALDTSGVGTIIPTAEQDFRGIVGHMERAIQPWQDPNQPHVHSGGNELLPWYRLMTLSDPHYVRGYMLGGYWLKRDNYAEALKFLDEGIANNPNAFQLHYTKGQIYNSRIISIADQGNDVELDQLRELAHRSFLRAAEIVLQQRPQGETVRGLVWWTDYVEEDARGSLRLAVLYEGRFGDPAKALKLGREALERVEQDGPLTSMVGKLERGEEL